MSEHHAIELDVTHARQARRGRHVLVVLIVSTALATIALFGAWAFFSGSLAGKSGEAPPAAARSVSQ